MQYLAEDTHDASLPIKVSEAVVLTLTSPDQRFSSPCWSCPSQPPSVPTSTSPPLLWTSQIPPCFGPLPAPGASDDQWCPHTSGLLLLCFGSGGKHRADVITGALVNTDELLPHNTMEKIFDFFGWIKNKSWKHTVEPPAGIKSTLPGIC